MSGVLVAVWQQTCVDGASRDMLLASVSRVCSWEEAFGPNSDLPHNYEAYNSGNI